MLQKRKMKNQKSNHNFESKLIAISYVSKIELLKVIINAFSYIKEKDGYCYDFFGLYLIKISNIARNYSNICINIQIKRYH